MVKQDNWRYEGDIQFAQQQELKRKQAKKILRKEEWQPEESKHAIYTELISPANGFEVTTLTTFIGEILAGGHTGMHRHTTEAAIFILEGRGYSIIEDEKVEWKEGDALCIPVMSWHQHFNTDVERRARYLAAINEPLMKFMGLFVLEHREDKKF